MILANKQGCIIVLSSTHKAWSFGSVTSTVIALLKEKETLADCVCVWWPWSQLRAMEGHLKGLLHYALVCAFVPLCLLVCTVCAWICPGTQGWIFLSFHLYVHNVSGYLCICVSVYLYALLPPYVFAYVHAACLCILLYFGIRDGHKQVHSVKGIN